MSEIGGPSKLARSKIPNMKLTRPKDFFDLQLTPEFVEWLTLATNCQATADGAGSGTGSFKDWVVFDVDQRLVVILAGALFYATVTFNFF
jgi:hypothetical protein